ncbi:MAG: GatB/YqeY domain-containing protein [Calditrichales bacterium]|nr:MAG: GatB/YqeY domain-containing protein [Calditrichales bacterium]
MSIEERLLEDMKRAMKTGDKIALSTIRMVRSQIKKVSIDKREALTEEESAQVLQKEAKKRHEAIDLFKQGNRQDLVDKEQSELEIISRYLPEQLSEKDLEIIVKEVVDSLGVSGEKDMGRVMGALMPKVKGKADGKLVQQKVKEYLAAI